MEKGEESAFARSSGTLDINSVFFFFLTIWLLADFDDVNLQNKQCLDNEVLCSLF